MKKFLGILFISGALVACNNSGDSTTGADSTVVDDSLSTIPPATSVDSTATMGVDSTNSADSTK
jgi:hypothetical protein